ncbi:hypothetical protein GO755_27480 [Spirosoma sp. HMF4905]|uniref:Uncharacterized protein n=1 Tax=Spirosoma arboris TaxID=2682092 RepID=A0A7K1SJ25_9BACT|nr:hypothetical protein [Spirosoma arboris]MVM33810.1 hypothetical protein [Spirosoma arboris]
MDVQEGNATLLTPQVLLRLMLYTDTSQRSATQFAPDAWVDFDTAFGPTFQVGTEHQMAIVNEDRKSIPYRVVVVKAPLLEQTPHPDESGDMVPMATLYLMPAAQAAPF